MAHETPQVHDGVLTLSGGNTRIAVESDGWWHWLDEPQVTTFRFFHQQGSFTARRERKSGGQYWYAYRRHQGKLHKAYLGKSEELYLARLDTTAVLLLKQFEKQEVHTQDNGHAPGQIMSGVAQGQWQADQLLKTKLYHPPARVDRVIRSSLLKRLDASLHSKLTLISAPAGFGKTTLMVEWLADAAVSSAWLSLDSADNDPMRFWTYVFAALETLCPGLYEQLRPLLYPPPWPPIEALLTIALNTLAASKRALLLVLDDYHLISEQTIHEAMTFLIDHLPPQAHIALLSRTDPPLPLMRLRVKGQLHELRAVDLRFSFDETTSFFRQVMKLDLARDEIAALDAHTEGWVAGLQLAALSMQGRTHPGEVITAFTGSHHYILSYLTDEVLHGQSERVRRFLLDTSVLERFNASLCNAVCESDDAQELLQHLEHANLFLVSLDEQRVWYRYHHLFADFLRTRLREEQPEHIQLLHKRASAWFMQHELMNEAVEHALAADDPEGAARIAETYAQMIVMRGEISTFLHWVACIPETIIHHHPFLLLYRVGSLITVGHLDEAQVQLSIAEQVLGEEPYASSEDTQTVLAAVRASLAAFQGNLEQALELSQLTLKSMPQDDPYVRSIIAACLGNVYLLTGDLTKASASFVEAIATGTAVQNRHVVLASMSAQGYVQAAYGHLRQATETHRQAIRLGTEQGGKMFPTVSMSYGFLAEILCEWNELDEAERFVLDGIEIGKQWGYLGMLAQGHIVLAHCALARGQMKQALAMVQQAEEIIKQSNLTRLISMIVAYHAWIQLKVGNIEAVRHWASTADLSEHDTFTYPKELEHVIYIEILIALGRGSEAQRIISRLLPVAEAGGRVQTTIMCLVMQALLLQAQGRLEPATDTLARALLYGEGEGYVRSIIDYGMPVIPLLRHAAARGIAPNYVRTLLTAIGDTLNGHTHYLVNASVLLSERELHVLQRIAAGRSNQEIAQDLVVAQSTIKTHINNIYAKLGVHSRTRAIAVAKKLGLLT